MDTSIPDIPKSRGRPSTGGRKEGLLVRIPASELQSLDQWIEQDSLMVAGRKLSRPEALRWLAVEALSQLGLVPTGELAQANDRTR